MKNSHEYERYSNFTVAYEDLFDLVYNRPDYTVSPRGMAVKEKLAVRFCIENALDRIPYVRSRNFSIAYMIAELLWYLSANDSTDWIAEYSSFWRNISDDGKTANSAYGSRIFLPHRRVAGLVDDRWTQWQYIVDELSADPDSRRAVIHIRSPIDSLEAHRDVPCTLTLQFLIRGGLLHQVATMRSSDIVLGLAYDVPAFTVFQELLANQIGVGLGSYVHVSNSFHVYERHYKMAEDVISESRLRDISWCSRPMPPMPKGNVPLELMLLYESSFRTCVEEGQFAESLNALQSDGVETYWKDWLRVLMCHWARKNKCAAMVPKIMKEITFKGYTFFDK